MQVSLMLMPGQTGRDCWCHRQSTSGSPQRETALLPMLMRMLMRMLLRMLMLLYEIKLMLRSSPS